MEFWAGRAGERYSYKKLCPGLWACLVSVTHVKIEVLEVRHGDRYLRKNRYTGALGRPVACSTHLKIDVTELWAGLVSGCMKRHGPEAPSRLQVSGTHVKIDVLELCEPTRRAVLTYKSMSWSPGPAR